MFDKFYIHEQLLVKTIIGGMATVFIIFIYTLIELKNNETENYNYYKFSSILLQTLQNYIQNTYKITKFT